MGIILNPRGAGGAGKTALVRQLMAAYGAPCPIHRAGRARPIGYVLPHPAGGRPLVVLGAYEATRGGCDTIPARDGGLEEAIRLAGAWAAEGHDVVLEGLQLSLEQRRVAALAAAHPVHILHLATPPQDCARALVVRHRAGRAALLALAQEAMRLEAGIAAACASLEAAGACIHRLGAKDALRQARALLGLGASAPSAQDGDRGGREGSCLPASCRGPGGSGRHAAG